MEACAIFGQPDPISFIWTKPAQVMTIRIKRVYEQPDGHDGQRILVDRLWPRGLTKEKASVDLWLKDIAPSTELRKWFGHNPDRWEEFRERYRAELKGNGEQIQLLRQELDKGVVTLVYGAKDAEHNHAVVLREYYGSLRTKKSTAPDSGRS